MFKRSLLWVLMVCLLFQVVIVPCANAETAYDDVKGHWASEQIQFLTERGIYKGNGTRHFYPDKPITRGEALVLANRVFEAVYGPLAAPEQKAYLDYRYPLRKEIEAMTANLQVLLDVQTGFVNEYRPGDKILYYLHLVSQGQLMKTPQKELVDWWVPTQFLQYPLSREEASMIFFHLLAPYKLRTMNAKPQDIASFFAGYQGWKQPSYYPDTASPYAGAIREFHLFNETRLFNPYKNMTRAEFATVLKRLYDFYTEDAAKQFRESQNRQQTAVNMLLTAANYAHQTKNEKWLDAYLSKSAQESIDKIGVPLHDYRVTLTLRKDDTDKNKLWVTAAYVDSKVGKYELEYLLEPDDGNPFGRKVMSINIIHK
ncbi:MAG: S-layer protein [Brevibacillus sp.]|nr:MAG: S-layer protein [Brevibacillus sp.]